MEVLGVPLRPGRAHGKVDFRPDSPEIALVVPGRDETLGGDARVGILVAGTHLPDILGTTESPAVGRVDLELFRPEDDVELDGGSGRIELRGVERADVVTAFLQRTDGKILLLKRSDRVGSFQGRWAGVSGFLEAATAEAQAYREILEETAIERDHLRLEAAGGLVFTRDGRRVFAVHGFRFHVDATEIKLDWEHSEFEWVEPTEIARRSTVPKLEAVWNAVNASPSAAPTSESKR